MSALVRGAARGAAAGTVGTAVMSALMLGAGRLGLVGRQPPEAITRTAVERVTGEEPTGVTADVLASIAHLGFGATTGAVYGVLPPARHVPPAGRGAALGLAVWWVSYRGWVPHLLGALPSAERDRPDRVAVMVTGHVVYGAVLGALDDRWRSDRG